MSRLYRKMSNAVIGGVCSGLSKHMNVNVILIRLIFILLFIIFGVGIIPYMLLWLVLPSQIL